MDLIFASDNMEYTQKINRITGLDLEVLRT